MPKVATSVHLASEKTLIDQFKGKRERLMESAKSLVGQGENETITRLNTLADEIAVELREMEERFIEEGTDNSKQQLDRVRDKIELALLSAHAVTLKKLGFFEGFLPKIALSAVTGAGAHEAINAIYKSMKAPPSERAATNCMLSAFQDRLRLNGVALADGNLDASRLLEHTSCAALLTEGEAVKMLPKP